MITAMEVTYFLFTMIIIKVATITTLPLVVLIDMYAWSRVQGLGLLLTATQSPNPD